VFAVSNLKLLSDFFYMSGFNFLVLNI